jgi:hypothetical protein
VCAPRRWPADAPRLKKRAFASHVYGLSLALKINGETRKICVLIYISSSDTVDSVHCVGVGLFNWHFIALVLKPCADFQSSQFYVEKDKLPVYTENFQFHRLVAEKLCKY